MRSPEHGCSFDVMLVFKSLTLMVMRIGITHHVDLLAFNYLTRMVLRIGIAHQLGLCDSREEKEKLQVQLGMNTLG